ncbi:hypothetical protein, partial [Escherichia coli]|uniref:hypothetical protein n=1 Tax=Escherichia coli TaxID=562 RepID=UPI0028A27F3F
TLIYKDFILIFETTLRQHLAILRQQGERVFLVRQAVRQHLCRVRQHEIANVVSAKPRRGAACRAVRQQRQQRQHYFCLYTKKSGEGVPQ